MNSADVFRLNNTISFSRRTILETYWDLELMLSEENKLCFSSIDLQNQEERTCALCLRIHSTTEEGITPYCCGYERCNQVRKFFNISGNITKFTNFSDPQSNRSIFLKNKMNSILGAKKLSDIDREIRFEFLLNAMLERLAYEYKKND